MLFVVIFATPLSILPCKDTVEELMWGSEHRMTKKQNVMVTAIMCAIALFFALVIPNFGDALTILGATTNSAIGFLFPIIYYLKMEKDNPKVQSNKIICYIIFVFICCASVIELGTFVYTKLHPPPGTT